MNLITDFAYDLHSEGKTLFLFSEPKFNDVAVG
jgi:hypothetical protein